MRLHSSLPLRARLRRWALGFDAWLNAALYESGRRAAEGWRRYSEWIDRLTVRGPKRVVLDLTSEAVTLGAGGCVVMLALAVPAFRETSENWLKKQDLAVVFLDRYGQEVGRRGIKHDDSVKLDEFPDYLVKAALATEDRRFFEHWGIDPIGTFRAVTVNARAGGVSQGGSSITQQLAKNLFLSNERSLERKIKEAFLALWLEFHLPKNEILKLYLDRAYMGGGTFGVGASAEYYFGKSVKDISLAEAAMLAGLFKAPTKYAPHVNLPAARARAADVLRNMVDAGFLTEGEIQTALRNPATPVDRRREVTPDFYLDWAFGEVQRLAGEGKFGSDRVLTVKTPLDVGLQKKAEQSVDLILRQHGDQYNVEQAAMVVMEPDGAVRTIVGGNDYGQSQFNRATDALRQPGSSFKPFVYATALTYDKYHPDTVVTDSAVCIGNWCPANYGRSYAGSMPLWMALAKSINTIPVKMSISIGRAAGETHEARAAKIGRMRIIQTAKSMGLTTALNDTVSLPIGAAEVTVLDMTAGYAVFANGGRRAVPYAAVEVHNSNGDLIYRRDRNGAPAPQVLAPRVISEMNFMMSKVNEEGTGKRAALEGIKSAGKTGTTNGYRDAWYVGFTGNLVAGIWFGNDDYASTNKMTGGSLPAMTWHEVMDYAHQNIEIKPIPGLKEDGSQSIVASNRRGGTVQGASIETSVTASAGTLSKRSYDVIGGIGDLFRSAARSTPTLTGLAPVQAADNAGAAPSSGSGRTAIP